MPVQAKLATLAQSVELLTEKATRTKQAIDNARERLSGGFERDSEYNDLYSALKKLVADHPIIETKRDNAEHLLERCQAWLDSLSDDATFEVVKVKPNGADLASVRELIKSATDELETLSRVSVPSSDIEQRVAAFVTGLARPKVSGVGDDEKLQVSWPRDDAVSLFALLMPDKMAEVILAEIERAANQPMALDQRRKRMHELRRIIDELQRQAYALGADAYALAPEIVLGVRVVKRETVAKVERRVAASA